MIIFNTCTESFKFYGNSLVRNTVDLTTVGELHVMQLIVYCIGNTQPFSTKTKQKMNWYGIYFRSGRMNNKYFKSTWSWMPISPTCLRDCDMSLYILEFVYCNGSLHSQWFLHKCTVFEIEKSVWIFLSLYIVMEAYTVSDFSVQWPVLL